MTKGINKVILIGNIGNDPETRTFPDGGSVTNVSVATSETWKDRQTGQQQEKTEWHKVVLKDRGNYKLGQIAGQYLKKGAKIYIEGKLQTRKWTDKQGKDNYTTEIVLQGFNSTILLLDKKESGSSNNGNSYQSDKNYGQAYEIQKPDDEIPF